jgi:hypothetical protein
MAELTQELVKRLAALISPAAGVAAALGDGGGVLDG